jgi:hypothetical protein
VIKIGPILENSPFCYLSKTPLVLCEGDKTEFSTDAVLDGIIILGATDILCGYPFGTRGELSATLIVKLATWEERIYPLRNGIEITTAFATYRSSRIDPRAEDATRFMEFSYDKSFECYVMNKITLSLGKTERVISAELIGEGGHIILTYALLGYKN